MFLTIEIEDVDALTILGRDTLVLKTSAYIYPEKLDEFFNLLVICDHPNPKGTHCTG